MANNLIRGSGLDWTIVQPTKLHDGPLRRQYRVGEHLAMSGLPAISRADIAHFILDHLSDATTFGKTLVISD